MVKKPLIRKELKRLIFKSLRSAKLVNRIGRLTGLGPIRPGKTGRQLKQHIILPPARKEYIYGSVPILEESSLDTPWLEKLKAKIYSMEI